MTRMKRILSILAIGVTIVCLSMNASAQDSTRRGGGGGGFGGGQRRSPEERAKMQTAELVKTLSLDKATEAKVDSINLKFAKDQQAAMQNGGGGGDRESRMAAMKKWNDDKSAAFKTIFTDKQYADYLKWQDEQQKARMNRGGGGPGGGGLGGNGGGN